MEDLEEQAQNMGMDLATMFNKIGNSIQEQSQ